MWLKIRLKPKLNWLIAASGENVSFRNHHVSPVIVNVLRAPKRVLFREAGEPPGTSWLPDRS